MVNYPKAGVEDTTNGKSFNQQSKRILDPRVGSAVKHRLEEVILIGIMEIISNGNTYVDMELFGKTHIEVLRQLKAPHIVTAFASDLKLTFGQIATEEKSNEIAAILKLLNLFCVKGKVIHNRCDEYTKRNCTQNCRIRGGLCS